MSKIATIVNFCTNDARFIRACLEEAEKFSSQIIVPVCDHFFDGSKEDRDLLDKIYASFPKCLFVEYPFIPEKIPKKILKKIPISSLWTSVSRLLACEHVDPSIDKVLFLDADEIIDGDRFSNFLKNSPESSRPILKIGAFWYFRETSLQAKTWEEAGLLVDRNLLKPPVLLQKGERDAIFDSLRHEKKRNVLGLDGAPMVHHFSWVRSKDAMLKKVRSWGHRDDRDWETLVNQEFAHPFKGVDFVHGYSYRDVNPPFSIPEIPSFDPIYGKKCIQVSEDTLVSSIKRAMSPLWNLIFRKQM